MLLVLYMLIICMTQVSDFSNHGRNDDAMETMEICRDGVSQIALECDKCMNQDWYKMWFYGSPVPEAKCFDFCNSITQQIQCLSDKKLLRKLETELEICTGNFQLATLNNQTTIKSLHLLNESLNHLSKSFEALGYVELQLRGLKSQTDSIYQIVKRKVTGRLKPMQLRLTRLQDEHKNYTDNAVVNASTALQADILKECTFINEQLMSSFNSSETNIKTEIGVLTKKYDEYMKNIKTDQSQSEGRWNKTVQELSDSLRTVNETTQRELEAAKTKFQKQLEVHKAELETQLKGELNDGITNVSNAWKQELDNNSYILDQKLEDIKMNMTREKHAIESIETLFRTMKIGLQLQIRNVKKELQLTINKQRSIIKRKLESKIENMNTGIKEEISEMEQRIIKEVTRQQTQEVSQIVTKQTEKVDIMNTGIKEKMSEMEQRIFTEVTRQTQEVSQIVTKQKEKVDIMYRNTFNKEMLQMAFLCLVVLVMINFAMVYYYRPSPDMTTSITGNVRGRFQSSIEILKQVPSKPQLQEAVCIISFDEGRQAAHQQLLDSANLPNCRVVTFVVRRHAHIPDLPRCKVYLMCTEFSERHVIIEEQGLGLGDLHRTTYDAVLKLGGQLIILYTRDPGSRRLKDDEVYNKNIYCVTHQEELVELNNLGRFFSVYDALTTQQKTKLKQTIMECFH